MGVRRTVIARFRRHIEFVMPFVADPNLIDVGERADLVILHPDKVPGEPTDRRVRFSREPLMFEMMKLTPQSSRNQRRRLVT